MLNVNVKELKGETIDQSHVGFKPVHVRLEHKSVPLGHALLNHKCDKYLIIIILPSVRTLYGLTEPKRGTKDFAVVAFVHVWDIVPLSCISRLFVNALFCCFVLLLLL